MKYSTILLSAFLAILMLSCNSNQNNNEMNKNGTHEDWSRNAVIYEVNIRQYTPEGTFSSFAAHLPRLHDMGVDILWLMPVHPVGVLNRKGSLGSYYAVQDYRAVNPEFGTMDDFKKLVDEAHKLGMKVILDWVANHSAWDNVWTRSNPEFFEKDEKGGFISPYDWTDVISLDYTNATLRDSMIGALKFWITEAGIDGYRCDVAGMVPTDFWDEARKALEAIKPVFMLAEDEDNADLLREAFDMNYAWKIHKVMNGISKGDKTPVDFWEYYRWNDSVFKPSDYRMNFITNHDENSWNGTEKERMGEGVGAFAALTFMMPGMPLLYSGQEAGLNKRLRFFDKDTVEWHQVPYHDFYKKMITLKKENSLLWNGVYGSPMIRLDQQFPEKILSFARVRDDEAIIAMFNLSGTPVKGVEVLLDDLAGKYTDLITGEKLRLESKAEFSLEPWEYRILKRR